MKALIVSFILFTVSLSIHARTLDSEFHSLDKGHPGADHILRLMSGEVAFIPYGEKNLLKSIEELHQGDEIKVTLDKKQNLVAVELLKTSEFKRSWEKETDDSFVASVLSLKQAGTVFKRMSKKYQNKSQCFNRAHIWVHDENAKYKTNLNKVFLFFTSRYIRKYRFHWWFHVTPMAYVGGRDFRNWRMLDRRYTKGPLQPKTWTNIFIKSKRTCKVADKFSEYFNNQNTQDCYMIKASQYYLVPSDLDMLETEGIERTGFDPVEVEHARWEAF